MFKKRLASLAPMLALAAFAVIPAVAQAAVPRWFINGVKASTKHEGVLAFGPLRLSNALLETWECDTFSAGQTWNEVVNGTERGLVQTTGFGTWDCTASNPVNIKNSKGETAQGVFLTAEGPPEMHSEKAHKTGNTSLPWSGELTEKEAGKIFVKTHNMKVWVVIPLCTEEGGSGQGKGCVLQGNEVEFEAEEGPTEKAAGEEPEPKWVNGTKNGLSPSKLSYEGQKEGTEKNGRPETGRLESSFGAGFMGGSFLIAGSTGFELVQAK